MVDINLHHLPDSQPINHPQPYHLDLYSGPPRRHSPHLYGRMARWTRRPRWSRAWRSCPRPSRPTPSRWRGRAPRHGCSWHGKVVPQVMTNVYGECDDSNVDLGWNLKELGLRDIRCSLDGTNMDKKGELGRIWRNQVTRSIPFLRTRWSPANLSSLHPQLFIPVSVKKQIKTANQSGWW